MQTQLISQGGATHSGEHLCRFVECDCLTAHSPVTQQQDRFLLIKSFFFWFVCIKCIKLTDLPSGPGGPGGPPSPCRPRGPGGPDCPGCPGRPI